MTRRTTQDGSVGCDGQQQLILGIQRRDDYIFDSYVPGTPSKQSMSPNVQVLHALKRLCEEQSGDAALFLWGGHGSGRSHLLQAVCEFAHGQSMSPVYLPMRELRQQSPQLLEGLDGLDIICVDDIHVISGDDAWEESLFHLYNRLRENAKRLIVSSDQAPRHVPIQLADLKSRLCQSEIYHLELLHDTDKMCALIRRAHMRGIELSEETARFILNRCPRSMTSLFETLDRLDNLSLQEKRKLTIPFIKMAMKW